MSGRGRAPNYTSEEKIILINIISGYKNIIECKKSDTITWKDKEAAWIEINQFNAASPNLTKRSKQSLQKYYENKKKEIRKSVANERLELFKTGGGKSTNSEVDPTKDFMLAIMNKKSIVGLDNQFDGDQHNVQTFNVTNSPLLNSESIILEDMTTEVVKESNTSLPSTNVVDWGNYKATNLKTPLSKKLKYASASPKSGEHWTERRRPTQALHSSHIFSSTSNCVTQCNKSID